MGWTIRIWGVRFPVGGGDFSLRRCVQTGFGAHPTSYPGALSLRVKWLGCEADHLPPSSVEVKNAWRYNSTPQYIFIACCLVKPKGQLSPSIST